MKEIPQDAARGTNNVAEIHIQLLVASAGASACVLESKYHRCWSTFASLI